MKKEKTSNWQEDVQVGRLRFLKYLLGIASLVGLIGLVAQYVSLENRDMPSIISDVLPFGIVWLIIVIAWLWKGLGYRIRAWITVTLGYGLCVLTFYRGGLPGSGRVWAFVPPVLAFVLLGTKTGIWISALSILTYIGFAVPASLGLLESVMDKDVYAWDSWLSEGASFLPALAVITLLLWSFSRNWLSALEDTSATNRELAKTNRQLKRQTAQLRATTEIARAGSSILDPEKLQSEVISRIQEGFEDLDVYYVGLFIIDKGYQNASLKAATGEAGQLLLNMKYKVQLSEETLVGKSILYQQAFTALEIGEAVYIGPLPMPNTRSQIVLPLRSRGRVLGALEVHSTQEDIFTRDDVNVLQTVADQVAVALDNAQLFHQTETALTEVQTAQRRYLTQAWEEFLSSRPTSRFDYFANPTEATATPPDYLTEAKRAAMVHGKTVATNPAQKAADQEKSSMESALVVPLKLRGQVIGTITLHNKEQEHPWKPDEIALTETVAEEAALTVENLRLLDDTQRRAARERAIRAISDRMQQATDINSLMHIAAEEVKRALGSSRAYVRLHTTLDTDDLSGNGHDEGDL